ncbi:MAG: hypothetical protein M5U09_02140 [Gammaproteobacteria bacterium]|nr:hypothetical protein [Gammaproteobacteria bacterium]
MNSRLSPGRSGFRRWHERQLFEAFGWLAVCLLCGVVFAAVLELVGLSTPGLTPIITMVVLYLTGLAGVAAWRRFWSTLSRAQAFAEGATCGGVRRLRAVRRHLPRRCHRGQLPSLRQPLGHHRQTGRRGTAGGSALRIPVDGS